MRISILRTIVRDFFFVLLFLSAMKEQIGFVINKYIIQHWMCDYMYDDGTYMYTKFANDHFIDEKIARKIVANKNYKMSVETLESMCDARDMSLEKFFNRIKR